MVGSRLLNAIDVPATSQMASTLLAVGAGEDDGDMFGGMFDVSDEYESTLAAVECPAVAVVSRVGTQTKTPSPAKNLTTRSSPSSLERLRVSDFGAEGFWHGRWSGCHQDYEWFSVGASAMWPALLPVAADLGLCRPLAPGEPPRAIEMGAGLSRISLDLVLHHGVQGIVVTDVVPHCIEVGRRFAEEEGVQPPVISFAVEDATNTSYSDSSFRLVLDKVRMPGYPTFAYGKFP
jgi:hypothetical protein